MQVRNRFTHKLFPEHKKQFEENENAFQTSVEGGCKTSELEATLRRIMETQYETRLSRVQLRMKEQQLRESELQSNPTKNKNI